VALMDSLLVLFYLLLYVLLMCGDVVSGAGCVGGYAQSGSGNNIFCTPCSGGTAAAAGSASCSTCPANTFSADTADSCTSCVVFSTSNPGSTTCTCDSDKITVGVASSLLCIYYPTSQPTTQPTRQPMARPTSQPSSQPTRQPSSQPIARPTRIPSSQPTRQPSTQPTGQPTVQPSVQPTREPTTQPTTQPTSKPSNRPTTQPTSRPTCQPSVQPSNRPTRQPTSQPSARPSGQPSRAPTKHNPPSSKPTGQPSRQPTGQPTLVPSCRPSRQPTAQPSRQPSAQPTVKPTKLPTSVPTVNPSGQPTKQPSCQPTSQPTRQPTGQPTRQPTAQPSGRPTRQPTAQPTSQPSTQPSGTPTVVPTAAVVIYSTKPGNSQIQSIIGAASAFGLLVICCASCYGYVRCCSAGKNRAKIYDLTPGDDKGDGTAESFNNNNGNSGKDASNGVSSSPFPILRPITPAGCSQDILADTMTALKAHRLKTPVTHLTGVQQKLDFGNEFGDNEDISDPFQPSPTKALEMRTGSDKGSARAEVEFVKSKGILNQCVIFIKPQCNSVGVRYAIESALTERVPGSEIVAKTIIPAAQLQKQGILGRQYSRLQALATEMNANNWSLALSPAEEELFSAKFGDSWQAAVGEDRVYSAAAFMKDRKSDTSGLEKLLGTRGSKDGKVKYHRLSKGLHLSCIEETYVSMEYPEPTVAPEPAAFAASSSDAPQAPTTALSLVNFATNSSHAGPGVAIQPQEPSQQQLVHNSAEADQSSHRKLNTLVGGDDGRNSSTNPSAENRIGLIVPNAADAVVPFEAPHQPLATEAMSSVGTTSLADLVSHVQLKVAVNRQRKVYVVNWFYPKMQQSYISSSSSSKRIGSVPAVPIEVHAFLVEWDGKQLPWAQFLGDVIGSSDPAEATASSIRGNAWEDWERLGLARRPTRMHNVVHASASALEGMMDRLIWFSGDLTTDSLGSMLIAAYGTGGTADHMNSPSRGPQPQQMIMTKQAMIATLQRWLANPVLELPEPKLTSVKITPAKQQAQEAKAKEKAILAFNGHRIFELFDRCDTNDCVQKVGTLLSILNSQLQAQQRAATPGKSSYLRLFLKYFYETYTCYRLWWGYVYDQSNWWSLTVRIFAVATVFTAGGPAETRFKYARYGFTQVHW
jgi:hypothetical protein